MQPANQPPATIPAGPGVNVAAAEREAHFVNNEQIFAAALFAKQLQADLGGIRNAMVGDGLKVPNVDMNKVMPSEIYKNFRPTGTPPAGPNVRPSAPVPVLQPPPGPVNLPVQQHVPLQPQVVPSQIQPPTTVDNQLEFNFNKVTRYEEVVEAIEKLEKKINIISSKIELLLEDKKKLNTLTNENGTQTG